MATETTEEMASEKGATIKMRRRDKLRLIKRGSISMTKPETKTDDVKVNVVRLAYGLLWHSRTGDKLVHEARKTLLAWLNDKDQQKLGIEDAKTYMEGMRHDRYN